MYFKISVVHSMLYMWQQLEAPSQGVIKATQSGKNHQKISILILAP